MSNNQSTNIDLESLPGHYVRRIHQLVVAFFSQELSDINITPVQYSSLQSICNNPGIDQGTLAKTIGFDTSTIGSVIDRLEARGLVSRTVSPGDKRVRLLTPTDDGRALLAAVIPPMLRSQQLFLEPLSKSERTEFMRLMKVLVKSSNDLSAAPNQRGKA